MRITGAGNKVWELNKQFHRVDGPAIIYTDGIVEYFLHDSILSKTDWEKEVAKIKKVGQNNPKVNWKELLHKHLDAPNYDEKVDSSGAILEVDSDGDKKWTLNGKLHRDDGPAYIDLDGHKEWWRHGKLHREDGPAVMYASGKSTYYLNHVRYPNKVAWNKALTDNIPF